ncbi:MAG: adenylyltransferase, partial [Acidobacteriota bacterium]
MQELNRPYGNKLVDLLVPKDRFAEMDAHAKRLPSIQLSDRALCDLELLATGAFSPLERFMGARDYQAILNN